MQKKEYLTEENYHNTNQKVKKIGTILIVIGLILAGLGIFLVLGGFLGFSGQIFNGIENQDINITVSNIVAFVLSVLFAFFTNKYYVFEDKNKESTIIQLTNFTISRIFTFAFEMIGILLFVNLLHIDKLLSKIVFSFIVVILNYIFSKLFIFKKKNKGA